MKTQNLSLRCFAERRNGHWVAFCLDLNLGAQGSTLSDVRGRLDRMVHSYLDDICDGDESQYFDDLFPRRAPLDIWLRYYYLVARSWARKLTNSQASARLQLFREAMPNRLGHC